MEGAARRPQDPEVPPQDFGGGSYLHQVFRLSIQRQEGHGCPGPSNCPYASGGGRFQPRSWRSSKAFRLALLGPQHHPAPPRAPRSHCPQPFTYITSSSQGDQKVLHFQRELVLVKHSPLPLPTLLPLLSVSQKYLVLSSFALKSKSIINTFFKAPLLNPSAQSWPVSSGSLGHHSTILFFNQ